MNNHLRIFLLVQPHILAIVAGNPPLFRPAFYTSTMYWLAGPDFKLAYRPSRTSTYKRLLKEAMRNASPEIKQALQEIVDLGDNFTPMAS